MEKYSRVKEMRGESFRRATGVKKETFLVMLEIVEEAEKKRIQRGGRKRKLSIPDCLLLTLEYLREYRTYFHIGVDYGISESQTQRTHKWIEKVILSNKRFHLPKKREWQEAGTEIEVVLVDATECEIERPKKNSGKAILEKRKSIR